MDLASETLNFPTFDLQFDCFSSRDFFLPNFDTKENDRSSSDVDSSSNLFETGGWLDDSFRQTSYSSPETTPRTSDFSTTNSTYDVHLKSVSKVDHSKQYYVFQTSQFVSSSCQQETVESKSSPLQDFSASCTSNKTFVCSYCNKQFTSEKYLSMHVSLHNVRSVSGESNNIQLIVEEFKSQGICPIERSKCRGSNKLASWTCKICLKTFAQNSNYKNHIRTHSNERPFVCNICSIGFKERYHLKKHVLFVHTSEMKEKCKVCGKKFKDSTAVRAHERTHSDLRPYTCQRCNKAFKTSECLWHHENRSKACMKNYSKTAYTISSNHEVTSGSTDAAKFEPVDQHMVQEVKCPAELNKRTDTSFNFYENLDYQQGPIKSEQPSGYCKDYLNNSSLNSSRTAHVISGYGRDDGNISGMTYKIEESGTSPASEAGKLICEHCDKVFVSVGAYKKHASSHTLDRPYRCEFCNVGFKLKVHLKKHNLYKHTDKFLCECRICGKRFKDSSAVKLHERIHSEERPFQCQCGKSFKTRENLWGHQHRGPCDLAYQMTKLPEEANIESWQTPCSDYIETNNDLLSNSSSIITSHEAYQTSETIPNKFLNSHNREIDATVRIGNNWKHPDDDQKQSMIHVAPEQHSIIPTAVVVPMKRNPSIICSPENLSPLKNANATAFLPPFESFKPEPFVDLSSSKNVFVHDSSRTIQNPDANHHYADFTLPKKLPDIQCMLQSFPQMRFTPVLSEQNHPRVVLEEPTFDTNRLRQGPWTGSKMSPSFDAYHKRSTFGRQLQTYQTRQEFQNISYPTSTMY